MKARVLCALFAISFAGLGCGDDHTSEWTSIVRQRASIEFPCPATMLTIEDLGGRAFRATGCGDFASYECSIASAEPVCVRAVQDGPEHLDAGRD